MGWKDLDSWLKGGIIGIIVYILATLVFWIIGLIIGAGAFFAIPSLPSLFVFNFEASAGQSSNLFWVIIISILVYFLIGALIGWIVGKIKSRMGKK